MKKILVRTLSYVCIFAILLMAPSMGRTYSLEVGQVPIGGGIVLPDAPVGKNVEIVGKPYVGETLKGSYDYTHPGGIKEYPITYVAPEISQIGAPFDTIPYYVVRNADGSRSNYEVFWWEIDDKVVKPELIGFQQSYTIQKEDTDKKIVFCYRPFDERLNKGKTVRSEPIVVKPRPKPVIHLNGDADMTIKKGSLFVDPGAVAKDPVDGDLTGRIVVGGDTVDTMKAGTYKITYNVTNSLGVVADEVVRTVVVEKPSPLLENHDSADANNIEHAYDGKYTTSANIFTQTGFIRFHLGTMGLHDDMKIMMYMGSSKEGSYPVTVSYLEDDGFLISNETPTVTGINDFYEFYIPAGAVFLRIDGLQANDTALYIYEIEKWRSPWTEDNPYHYNANNFKDAYDKVDTTSANIFSQNGFIKYLLSDMGLQDDMDIQMLMAGSEKGSYNMIVEFFLADGSDIPREIITVSELKLAYRLHVPAGATHIKIWGVDADKTALYIYEIQKWEADLPVDLPFHQANNITHAYDGSESTSANIFTEDGYILFLLSDMGLAAGDKVIFVMNGAEGNTQNVKVEALDSDKNVLGSIGIPITGFKNRYTYLIPPGTTYLKFYGMALEPLYIYEIMKWVDDISADNPYHANADHFRDAYDNDDVTSANIFSANGFIKYSLDTIGLSGVTRMQIIMCTTNDISPATPEVAIEFFDTDHAYMSGVRQTVSHVKNAYAFDIPAGAAYVKIWGVDNTVLCLFEIEKWTNANLFYLNANNFGDAYDGNDSSSANIFSGGYIVYKLSDIGVTADTTIKFMMNTIYGDIRAVVVSSLDSDMQALGTTTINLEKGFKKLYDFTIAANAEYLKIEGPGDTDLYIYEIIK